MLLAFVVKLFFVSKNFNQVKLTGAIKITFDFRLTFPLFIPFMKLRLGSKVSLSMFYGPEACMITNTLARISILKSHKFQVSPHWII